MIALLFNTLTLPASVGVALRSVSCGVASSVKSIWRAHASHTLRWSASETVIGVLSFPTTDAVASETSEWRFSSARPNLPASAFGNFAKVSFSAGSFAPNKSFKPTPHRGGNSVLCATLHAVATPPWGGLTPALGPYESSVASSLYYLSLSYRMLSQRQRKRSSESPFVNGMPVVHPNRRRRWKTRPLPLYSTRACSINFAGKTTTQR